MRILYCINRYYTCKCPKTSCTLLPSLAILKKTKMPNGPSSRLLHPCWVLWSYPAFTSCWDRALGGPGPCRRVGSYLQAWSQLYPSDLKILCNHGGSPSLSSLICKMGQSFLSCEIIAKTQLWSLYEGTWDRVLHLTGTQSKIAKNLSSPVLPEVLCSIMDDITCPRLHWTCSDTLTFRRLQ